MLGPTPCDFLITGGRILDLEAAEGYVDAAVAVAGGLVVGVDAVPDAMTRWAPQRHIDADGAYLAPGFVDGHVHLSAVLGSAQTYAPAIGASLFGGAGSTADIGRALHRFLSMPVPPDIVEAAVAPVLAALVAGGTTAVVDAGSVGIDGDPTPEPFERPAARVWLPASAPSPAPTPGISAATTPSYRGRHVAALPVI
jgi:cytosine/adenosine deaminase-related metal-dependent hydrolase